MSMQQMNVLVQGCKLVDRACSEYLLQPDWAINMEINDACNQSRGGYLSAAVLRAILEKCKLNKKPQVQTLALELLDVLMKNCSKFHRLVGSPEFMEAFVKTLPKRVRDPTYKPVFKTKRYNPPTQEERKVEERTLVLIQTWAAAFKNSRQLTIFTSTYADMRKKAVRFPRPNKNETAPVLTPARKKMYSTTNGQDGKQRNRNATSNNNTQARQQQQQQQQQHQSFTNQKCQLAFQAGCLLIDSLTASHPSAILTEDDLIVDLHNTCRALQTENLTRLQQNQTGNAALLDELFRVNDKLQEATQYYDGLLTGKVRRRVFTPTPSTKVHQSPSVVSVVPTPATTDADLEETDSTIMLGGGQGNKTASASTTNTIQRRKPSSVKVPTLAPPGQASPKKKLKKKKKKKREQDAEAAAAADDDEEDLSTVTTTTTTASPAVVDAPPSDDLFSFFGGSLAVPQEITDAKQRNNALLMEAHNNTSAATTVPVLSPSGKKKKRKKKKSVQQAPVVAAAAADTATDDDFLQLAMSPPSHTQPAVIVAAKKDEDLDDLFAQIALQ